MRNALFHHSEAPSSLLPQGISTDLLFFFYLILHQDLCLHVNLWPPRLVQALALYHPSRHLLPLYLCESLRVGMGVRPPSSCAHTFHFTTLISTAPSTAQAGRAPLGSLLATMRGKWSSGSLDARAHLERQRAQGDGAAGGQTKTWELVWGCLFIPSREAPDFQRHGAQQACRRIYHASNVIDF